MRKEKGEKSLDKDQSFDSFHNKRENETNFPNMNDTELGQSNINNHQTYYSYFLRI